MRYSQAGRLLPPPLPALSMTALSSWQDGGPFCSPQLELFIPRAAQGQKCLPASPSPGGKWCKSSTEQCRQLGSRGAWRGETALPGMG